MLKQFLLTVKTDKEISMIEIDTITRKSTNIQNLFGDNEKISNSIIKTNYNGEFLYCNISKQIKILNVLDKKNTKTLDVGNIYDYIISPKGDILITFENKMERKTSELKPPQNNTISDLNNTTTPINTSTTSIISENINKNEISNLNSNKKIVFRKSKQVSEEWIAKRAQTSSNSTIETIGTITFWNINTNSQIMTLTGNQYSKSCNGFFIYFDLFCLLFKKGIMIYKIERNNGITFSLLYIISSHSINLNSQEKNSQSHNQNQQNVPKLYKLDPNTNITDFNILQSPKKRQIIIFCQIFTPKKSNFLKLISINEEGCEFSTNISLNTDIDFIRFSFNDKYTHVLAFAETHIDKTGRSYYGKTNVYLINLLDKTGKKVEFPKEGPLHELSWLPEKDLFIALYGDQPSNAGLFNLNGKEVNKIGEGYWNKIRVNPQGTIFILTAFVGLSSPIECFKYPSFARICKIPVSDTNCIEWHEDGVHFICSVLSPYLRVSNNLKVYNYYGEIIFKMEYSTLYQAIIVKNYYEKIIFKEIKKKENVQVEDEVVDIYVPPSMRNDIEMKNKEKINMNNNNFNKEIKIEKSKKMSNIEIIKNKLRTTGKISPKELAILDGKSNNNKETNRTDIFVKKDNNKQQ